MNPATDMDLRDDRTAFGFRTVALVGASDRVHYHRAIIENLRAAWSATEHIYPVNPKRLEVYGLDCYPSIAAVPTVADLAIVATPAETVLGVVAECADAGVRHVIVLSSGFAEAGAEGSVRQDALRELVRARGVQLLGPSSLGIVDLPAGGAAFASALPPELRVGNVSAIFQSGGMLNLFLHQMTARRIGMSVAATTGSEASVSAVDLLASVACDDATAVVALYLEGIDSFHDFAAAAETALRRGKPVIVLRAGMSSKGRRNVQSHSGKVGTAGRAWSAFLRQKGVIEVHNLDQLIEVTALASRFCRIGRMPTGNRALVMSVSGGDCTLLADIADRTGWELPDPDEAAAQRLADLTGKQPRTLNPLDVGGLWRKGRLVDVARVVAEQVDVDVVGFRLNLPPQPEPALLDAYRALAREAVRHGKSPVAMTRSSESIPGDWHDFFDQEAIPVALEYERGLTTLRILSDWRRRRDRILASPLRSRSTSGSSDARRRFDSQPSGSVGFSPTQSILAGLGLRFPTTVTTDSEDEAVVSARAIPSPWVVKAECPWLLHKSDAGAVRLDVQTEDGLRQAYRAVVAAARGVAEDADAAVRVLVQEQVVDVGLELVIGAFRDPELGPTLVVGIGGILIELLDDVALRTLPISDFDAEEMLDDLHGGRLLDGFRGGPVTDRKALQVLLQAVGELVLDLGPQLDEFEMNPVIVSKDGTDFTAVDALMVRG